MTGTNLLKYKLWPARKIALLGREASNKLILPPALVTRAISKKACSRSEKFLRAKPQVMPSTEAVARGMLEASACTHGERVVRALSIPIEKSSPIDRYPVDSSRLQKSPVPQAISAMIELAGSPSALTHRPRQRPSKPNEISLFTRSYLPEIESNIARTCLDFSAPMGRRSL